ncbi:MAG: hypothetical protein NWE89_17140 [Candidatus Bathyarchaeota archaeon]|nr:hypothetical protein [Candidatus Bathyarchaeota archaeon]
MEVRRMAGIDAITEAIGRAVEMGRPVFCSHGISDMRNATAGPQTIAGLSVLSHVADQCVNLGARLIVPVRNVEVWPVATDIVETAYKAAGKGDEFNVDDVAYLSSDQFGYSSNYLGMMMREKAGANIMIGAYWAESLQLAETGNRVGAMQVAGTANTHQIAFFVVATDYCLIGEEIFAAAAYVTEDPVFMSSIAGQDFGRIIAVTLMILGTILFTFGSDALLQLMEW